MARADGVLSRGVLTTVTGDGTKDHEVCVWAEVRTADSATVLAVIQNGECGSPDTEYAPSSTHDIDFRLAMTAAEKRNCQCFVAFMWVTGPTVGEHTWRVREATITLYFSDGSTLRTRQKGLKLLPQQGKKDRSVRFQQGCGHFLFVD